MKLSSNFRQRLPWLNLPGTVLMLLLQRTPALSAAAVATEEIIIASPVGTILKSAVAAVTALGAVNTLVGATPLSPSSGTPTGVSVTTGTAVSVFYTVTGTQTLPQSWTVAGSVPPGLDFSGLTGAGEVDVSSLHLEGTPTTAGTYNLTLRAFRFTGGTANGTDSNHASPSYAYTITVTGPVATAPAITTQPQSQSVTAGSSVTFTAAASGTPTPTFQWKKGGVSISGATSSSFMIASVAAGDAGNYTVTATNSAGSATSNIATLTVNAAATAPAITTQPQSQSVTTGSSVTFSAAASGSPTPTFQWKKGGVSINGATATSFTIASVSAGNAGNYTVTATNSAGSATSNIATLTVNAAAIPPAITNQPASQTITAGNPVTFTVTASGTPTPTFQWKKGGVSISGATGSTYSIVSAAVSDAGNYTVVATNSAGSATSNIATLTVNAATTAPAIMTQPLSQKVTIGASVTFMVVASGTPPPTYQWRKDGVDINGATSSSYTIAAASLGDAGSYSVVVTNSAGSATSTDAVFSLKLGIGSDFNGDGKPDILLENTGTGQRVLWLMGGPDSQYVTLGLDLGFLDPTWHIVGTADFNGDGAPDILLENTGTGQRVLWLMGGPNNAYVTQGLDLGFLDPAWHIVGTGDFNGDGAPDILLENTGTGQRVLWLMGGPNNAYVTQGLDLGFLDPTWHIVN